METIISFLNSFIVNVLFYVFIVLVYGWAIYNIGKFILYLLSTVLAKIRKDIIKWRNNK